MPLYEYRCTACQHEFETLVRAGDTPACPSCASTALEKQLSLFAVDSDGTRRANRDRSMPKAVGKQRDKDIADQELYDRHHH